MRPSAGSAAALLAHEWTMRSLRCSSLHPNLARLESPNLSPRGPARDSRLHSVIAEALHGKTILVTGSTGFLGKSIVEKCLRSIPEVGRIYLAIRSSARRPATERLDREVLSSPAFKRLKEELGGQAFAKLVRDKLAVVEIDLGRDGLGLSDEGREQLRRCDVVIHSAAAVGFVNPADLSAPTNLLGAAR